MTTVASIGHGVRFLRSDGDSPDTYTDIGELLEPAGPSITRDAVEATHTLSPNRFREFISGLIDAGEATCMIALEPSASVNGNYAKLFQDIKNQSLVEYRILFPNAAATRWDFSGLITSMENAMPLDDRMTVSVTIKISGEPVLSDGA